MINTESNFLNDVIHGDASYADLDAYIEFWHNNDTNKSLHDFIGCTEDEYEMLITSREDDWTTLMLQKRSNFTNAVFMLNQMTFIQTCSACPEQYDVYNKNCREIGYIRLRYGMLRADYYGKTVYSHDFGDGYKGTFDNKDEQQHYLKKIATIFQEKEC